MDELAKTAYMTYIAVAGSSETRMPKPEYELLPKPEQKRWEAVVENVLRFWIETDFKNAVNDDEFLTTHGLRMLVVGKERGDATIDVFRTAIASVVCEIIAPGILTAQAAERKKQREDEATSGEQQHA